MTHNNQNTKYTEQGKNVKICEGKMPSNIQKVDLLELYPTSQQRL